MRTHDADFLLNDLTFIPKKDQTDSECQENTQLCTHAGSHWIFRRFDRAEDFYRDRLYHHFFKLFSPDHVPSRHSVYEIKEGKKIFIGSATPAMKLMGCTFLQSRDIHIWMQQDVPNALAVLFFLNQSYVKLVEVFVNLREQYQVIQLDATLPPAPLLESEYDTFLPSSHAGSPDAVRQLLLSNNECLTKIELALLNIVIAPDFERCLDFSLCDALKENLSARKMQLREILLNSNRFFDMVIQLSQDQLCRHFNTFFYCIKTDDPDNFTAHVDQVLKNYLQFFGDLIKNKFMIMTRELQREIGCVTFNSQWKISHVLHAGMIKSALNRFCAMLDESDFFTQFDVTHFHRYLSLFHVLHAIALNFEQNDVIRKQLITLIQTANLIAHAHPRVSAYLQVISPAQFETPVLPNEIHIDEIVQYSQDWISRTEEMGLATVLINKNMLLLFFDYAVSEIQSVPVPLFSPQSRDYLQSLFSLRNEANQFKTSCEIKTFVYKITRISDESFLTIFFRQWILHMHLELRLGMFIQTMMMQPTCVDKTVNDQIRVLLLQPVTNVIAKEFWNKLLLSFDASEADKQWCRVELQPVPPRHFTQSQSGFFESGAVTRVVVNSTENLLSIANQAAKSDSAKVMTDSLKSLAETTSHAVGAAAATAKEAVSSATQLLSDWWNRKS